MPAITRMKIQEKSIEVRRTARYCVNEVHVPPASVIYVIHGYAQLARDFIRDFEFLDNGNTLIVAPEGLSRSYFREKVGASWMTKEDRSNEIHDYVNYLEDLNRSISEKFETRSAEHNVLGFSQGVHTAVRWFINSSQRFNKLLLCSSDFPKDTDFDRLRKKLDHSELYLIHGTGDNIVHMKVLENNMIMLDENNIPFRTIHFDGKHEINSEAVLSALKENRSG